jgi:hypothetical protein
VPQGDELVEATIFYIPAIVTPALDLGGGHGGGGEVGDPDPGLLLDDGCGFAAHDLALARLLLGPDDADRSSERREGGEVGDVPQPGGFRSVDEDLGSDKASQSLGVLKEVAPFLLHDDHGVLARVEHLLEERGFEIQSVGRDHVDQPGVLAQDAAQEPSCRDDFSFPGTDGLEVQDGGRRDTDPLRDHEAVVVLEHGSGGAFDLPHQALRAATCT